MKKAKILALMLALITVIGIVTVSAFAASDVTTVKTSTFESSTVGYTATATDGKNPTLNNTTFQQGGRLGKIEVVRENENNYVLIRPIDKPGTSEAYAYMKLGSNGTAIKDGTTVTGVKKSASDVSNFKYMIFEVDIKAPTGRVVEGAIIDVQGRDINKSGNVGYWNTNATSNLIYMYNSSGTTYLSGNGSKFYINPYEFNKVQIIVENITTDSSTNIEIQSHVYVNGQYWFTKVATNVPTSYAGGVPNAVFTEVRINYRTTVDEKSSLAIDNLSWKTVPKGSTTTVEELVTPFTSEADFEYVSGGKTVIDCNTSLANAIKLADEGSTVKLLSDCKHATSLAGIAVDKNLTLDLNGYTIDGTYNRARRDGGLFVVSSNKTFTVKSSEKGGKIFCGATANTADPIVGTNSNSVVNFIGRNENGETTLSVFGAALVRAWSGDCTLSIDGGEYYRLKNSDYALIQLQKNFTLNVKNALLYDAGTESTDGIFSLNGRMCVGGTVISNATVDNCVIISKTNVVAHTYKNANILFTNCFISGDIKPEAFVDSTNGAQTPGEVTLGDGCAVNGTLADNVVIADDFVLQNIGSKKDVTVSYNSFAQGEDGAYTEDALTVESYNLSLSFDRLVSNEGLDIPVVWKDENGKVIANTTGLRGDTITDIPYDSFFENGAIHEYIKGWIDGVPNEWNESLSIPIDFAGEEYVLTYKEGGKLAPYAATFRLYFNVAAESHCKVNFYIPELPEGIELTSAYIGENLIYGDGVDNVYNVLLDGKEYITVSDFAGAISGATDKITATVTVSCDGFEVTREASTDMAHYCNTVIDGAAYDEKGKTLAANIANYLVSCADLAGETYTEITNALAEVVSENASRIKAPTEAELVTPDTSHIASYVSGVYVIIENEGPSFVFTLTEAGKAADVTLSSAVGNSDDEHYSDVGYIKTGKDSLANVNRITVTVIAEKGEELNLSYTLANYCKALEGTAGEGVARALYGFVGSQMAYTGTHNVSIEKYSSHNEAITASCGDEITYYIDVINNEGNEITVSLTDSVPENTAYVTGADNASDGRLFWNVTIPAGGTTTVSYTVKVNDDTALYDGGTVKTTVAAVGATKSASKGVIHIERTFNEADRKYIDIAIDALSDSTFEDLILAKWIYYVAYSQDEKITATDSVTLMNSLLDSTITADQLDKIAPTLYGGSELSDISGIKGKPCAAVYEENLIVGDIIIVSDAGTVKSYIYGSNGLYSLLRGCVPVDIEATLGALTDSDAYVVFRPSVGFEVFTPTDMEKEPDVLNEKQEALVDTAKYYLQRGEWLQYSDTYYAQSVSGYTNESRWEYGQKTPEESTSQKFGYINCAAFTHDVYWTTFGHKLPGNMYTTANLTLSSSASNMRMFFFSRSADQVHTDAEKAQVEQDFLETLIPGDIMVIRRGSSGHAMLYIGDGMFIHSSGSSYNYSGSYGVENYEPTIRYHRVKDYLFDERSTNGYIFGKVTDLSIVRPLNNATWAGYEVTEATKNRNANLQGIIVEKLPSVAVNNTVNPGDEITYTFAVNNTNHNAVTLDLSDKIPQNTVYVSGGETKSGDALSWTLNIPARTKITVSYTVKVAADAAYGTEIVSNDAVLAGVPIKTYSTFVRRTLTSAEADMFVKEFTALKAEGTLKGFELVNEVYKRVLGIDKVFADTDFATVTEGAEGVFTTSGMPTYSDGRLAFKPNLDGDYFDFVAVSLFGGRRVNTANCMNLRTELARKEHLEIGDIMVGRTLSSNVLYIYLGGDYMVSLTTLNNDTVTVNNRLERLPAYGYYYAILRPSFAAE